MRNDELKNGENIRKSGSRFLSLFEHVMEGMAIVNGASGDIIDANTNMLKLTGYEREKLLSMKIWDLNFLRTMINQISFFSLVNDNKITERRIISATSPSGQSVDIDFTGNLFHADNETFILISAREITQKEKIKIVQQSEQWRLQSIIEGTEAGTWEWNLESGMLKLNDIIVKMLGYEPHEISSTTVDLLKSIIHPEDFIIAQKLIHKHLSGETAYYEAEVRFKHKDGRWIWMHDRGKVISWSDDGKPLVMFGTHTDISKRKQAEEALRESEAKFRMLFNSGNDVIFVLKIDKDKPAEFFSEFNDAMCRKLGYTREEMAVLPIEKTQRPDFMKRMPALLDRFLEKKQIVFETDYFTKNGQPIPVEVSCSFFEMDGCPAAMTVARDITERKKNEMSLIAEKEQLMVTLRSIGDGVITTDTNGNISIMNRVAEEFTGWKQDEAEGKPLEAFFNIIDEHTRKQSVNPVKKVLETAQTVELSNNTILVSRDGTERKITDSAAPIKDRNNTIIGVVLVIRDVTEKQRLVDNALTIQKLESLGVLAGGIAHDFNNLLGGIFGYIELAQREDDRERIDSYLSKAMNSIDKARGLTSQLLTFSKGGAPKQETWPVFPFVQETIQIALAGKDVSCSFNVPNSIWQCSFDKIQIGQVLNSIITNAVESMQGKGKIEICGENVTISENMHHSLKNGKYVRISIKDYGNGIPKENLNRIFDPFFSTKSKGRGLGLSTCYSIMKQHNGSIDAESVYGAGSTFHIYIPAISETSAPPKGKELPRHTGNGTFLVMDDEEIMRETFSGMLSSFGYQVVCVTNGSEAVDAFISDIKNKHAIIGMIFDLTIQGGIGGQAAVSKIRELDSKIPVFVTSGYADDPIMKDPQNYGFTDSICKPFMKKELSDLISKHFSPV